MDAILNFNLVDVAQIIFADIILSGDNALVIGMAAAGLSPELRKKAIFMGMALAAGLRIFFAAIASYLLAIPGIIFFGGVLLSWVCWRFYGELKQHHANQSAEGEPQHKTFTGTPRQQLWAAMVTIIIADVSMSIDNVVAVAAIAREDTALLIFGLVVAIAFMAFFATMIMNVMAKYPWLSYLGLAFLIYLSAMMLYDGWPQVAELLGLSSGTAAS